MNFVKEIEQWQKDRLLDKQEFNDVNETTNLLEEIYELNGLLISKKENREIVKGSINFILERFIKESQDGNLIFEYKEPTEEDKVDALFDICVFAIGGMLKLGYKPECVFIEGIKHISSRTGSIVDGKFQKDTNVKTYEPKYSKCKR